MKEEAVEFLKNLKEEVKIISHNDVDGICSLAIMLNFLKKRGIIEEHEITKVPIEKLDKSRTMIFLDINTDNAMKFASKNTLIIDHHQFSKKPQVPFYNPMETDEKSYIPASYLVYEVCSELENMEEVKWIAGVGVIGDKGEENSELCRKFVDRFENKEELNLVSDYIFSTTLVEHEEGYEEILKILLEAKSSKEVIQEPYFKECYDTIQNEISKSRNKIERDGNIIFVEVESRYNIKSIIASQILDRNKNVIVVAYSAFEDSYNISTRTNMGVNLGEIAKKVAESCGGDGGGHRKAAGAKIEKKKLSVFKEEFISEVEKLGE
jgi:single-stranded DNA-specific DHH superfamily exonuclease